MVFLKEFFEKVDLEKISRRQKSRKNFPGSKELSILTGKRNPTIEFCQVRQVLHMHKLTMTRTFSKASGPFEFIDFCLSDMLDNLH